MASWSWLQLNYWQVLTSKKFSFLIRTIITLMVAILNISLSISRQYDPEPGVPPFQYLPRIFHLVVNLCIWYYISYVQNVLSQIFPWLLLILFHHFSKIAPHPIKTLIAQWPHLSVFFSAQTLCYTFLLTDRLTAKAAQPSVLLITYCQSP